MPQVSITKCSSYDQDQITKAVDHIFELSDGINQFVKTRSEDPSKTQPAFEFNSGEPYNNPSVSCAGSRSKDKSSRRRIWIGDSPGVGTLKGALRETGMGDVIEELGATLKEFNEEEIVKSPRGYSLKIAKPVRDADAVINIAKIKTHAQMFMTMGVKNCFGCIPGTEKAQWHYRAGINAETFAGIIVDTYSVVKPVFTIADGVMGLEGNGPGTGGIPRELGFLIGSQDAVALDRTVMEILNLPPDRLKILQAAKEMQAGETEINQITVSGVQIEEFNISNFKTPDTIQAMHFEQIPRILRKHVRKLCISRPHLIKRRCIKCGKCYDACPADAITWRRSAYPVFDYDKCIRCFCCQEMCPKAALDLKVVS